MRISKIIFLLLAVFTVITAVTRLVEAAVTMSSYGAAWLDNHQQVLVRWETATEVNNAGFRVYRGDTSSFTPTVQNRLVTIISQNGGSPIGAAYVYTDTPPAFRTYYYILQAIDVNATTEDYGPFPALDATPTATPTATSTGQATATSTATSPISPSPTNTLQPSATPVATGTNTPTSTPGSGVANPAQPQPPANLLNTSGSSYTVQSGDTLSGIARRYGVTVDALRRANNLTGDFIRVGQVLVIPAGGISPQPQFPPALQPQSFPPTSTPFPTPTAIEIAQLPLTPTAIPSLASPTSTKAAPSPTPRPGDSSSDSPFGLVQIVYATGLLTLLGVGCLGFVVVAVAAVLLVRYYKR